MTVPSIDLEIDDAIAVGGAAEKQLPFATSVGVNMVGSFVAVEQNRSMLRSFTIRRTGLIKDRPRENVSPRHPIAQELRPFGIMRRTGAATKDRPEVTVNLDSEQFGWWAKHETGGVRARGINPIAVPTQTLRPVPQTSIRPMFFPVNLGFFMRRDVGGGLIPGSKNVHMMPNHTVRRGPYGTFELDPSRNPKVSARAAGIYQRTGPGRGEVVRLWMYRDTIRIQPRLGFLDRARIVALREWPNAFQRAFDYAMATATLTRPKVGRRAA